MVSGTLLCANPLVAVFDDVFTAEEAARCIELGKDGLSPGKVVDAFSGTGSNSDVRTNTDSIVDQWSDPMLTELVVRISGLVRLPPENCEPAKLLHYEEDQKFEAHFDGFGQFSPVQAAHLANGGQRLFTTLLYLNDLDGDAADDAGLTVLPRLKIAIRPKLGRVLLFANTLPASDEVHPHSIHAGTSTGGFEKWVLNLSWREQMYHEVRQYPEETGKILTY